MPIFRCLPRSERLVQVRGISRSFVTRQVSTIRSSKHFAQPPKLVNHPFSVAGDRLVNKFAAAVRIWRLSSLSTTWRRTMSWWQESVYHGTLYPSERHCILTAPKWPEFFRITQPYSFYESKVHSMCTVYNTRLSTILFKNLCMPCYVSHLVALQCVYEHWNGSKFNNISGDNARDVIYWNWKSLCYFQISFPSRIANIRHDT